jgi:hypothetical protein
VLRALDMWTRSGGRSTRTAGPTLIGALSYATRTAGYERQPGEPKAITCAGSGATALSGGDAGLKVLSYEAGPGRRMPQAGLPGKGKRR